MHPAAERARGRRHILHHAAFFFFATVWNELHSHISLVLPKVIASELRWC